MYMAPETDSSSLLVNVFGLSHVVLEGSTPPDVRHGALC